MALQNLVSAALTADAKAEVLKDLGDVKKKLDFLTSLTNEELRSIVKVGNGYAPLLDKAHTIFSEHPEIMPTIFDTGEFKRDYLLYKDLTPIASQVEQLAEAVKNTMTALASDTMVQTLEIYSAVKQNRNKVSGLNAIAEEMETFFAKHRAKPEKKG